LTELTLGYPTSTNLR